jgi:ATP-dependent Clp protease adaptor protein ClpS
MVRLLPAGPGGRPWHTWPVWQYNESGWFWVSVFVLFEPPQMSESHAASVDVPVTETVRRQREQEAQQPRRQPRYHVILWDDNEHTYAYVMNMLRDLFGYPLEKGYQLAKEVDTRGKAIVLTTTREHAELKRDQIHAYGKDGLIENCKGSMWCTIEPEC